MREFSSTTSETITADILQRFSSTMEVLNRHPTKAEGTTRVTIPTLATLCWHLTSLWRTTTNLRYLGTRARLTTIVTRVVTMAAVLLSNRALTITTSSYSSKKVASTTRKASLGGTFRTARARRKEARMRTQRRGTSSEGCAESVQTRLIGGAEVEASRGIEAAAAAISKAVAMHQGMATDITRITIH